ncbi:unnamed protein product [Vicia faba]|uniref:Uncharacterized protein n=1 Tax=Vicia faba TaxID=3906 RepID=A0AAV0ZHD7_VICFA|nr:unnamed protein product [Vicia faba]
MRKRNVKRKKEEIAEDCCFVCKDGGNMRVCDFKDCLKTYHGECVGEDASFLTSNKTWCCWSHYCCLCGKPSKFVCFFCPTAVCGKCYCDFDFAPVKRNKGFCRHCSKLAFLIEKNADVDSDGEKVNMKDPATFESYFVEYYEVIKRKEGLNPQHALMARDIIKNRKKKCDMDSNEIDDGEDDSGESDVSNFMGSDSDDLDVTTGVKSSGRKKKCMKKLESIKGKVGKDKKKDFDGWGSRSLVDFLKNIGKDTTQAFSELDVKSIIIDYCQKNQLFDPMKKKRVLCDAKLYNLLRRKSVNKNNIQNLLASHFVENFEETDDMVSSSEEMGDKEAFKFSEQRHLNSTTKSCLVVSQEVPSGFAAINTSNLKLVYLKRTLIEELLKQPESFDDKVLGSFVRTKSDPNDYLQNNSHLLLQVIGINKSSKKGEINQEILLRLTNVPKAVPINKISDDDFSEEECQDLYQRMSNGVLKKPTTLELEQKARTLHEDIMKHWISREIAVLRNRIDLANEKGWRRELAQYIDRKIKLESPSEQSRLLSEIPNVIPEMVYTNLSPEDSSREDKLEFSSEQSRLLSEIPNVIPEMVYTNLSPEDSSRKDNLEFPSEQSCLLSEIPKVIPEMVDTNLSPEDSSRLDKLEQNDLSEIAIGENCSSVEQYSTHDDFAQCLDKRTDDADDRNLSVNMDVNQTIQERQSVTLADSVKATAIDVIMLSDSDEDDSKIKVTSSERKEVETPKATTAGRKGVESPEITSAGRKRSETPEIPSCRRKGVESSEVISAGRKRLETPEIPNFHCSGVYSGKRGPFSLSVLKIYSESLSGLTSPLDFKVWKEGESEREAIPLRDALMLFSPKREE